MIPLLPIALLQIFVCLATAMFLGLPFNKSILFMILVLLIISPLYISCGLLFGTLFTDKQVGGIFAIFVNVTTMDRIRYDWWNISKDCAVFTFYAHSQCS
ncbi:hypothetical protein [Lysinibacillus boronitolerans]|uniref:hypothetical protein n=1 Tax=Lysinibacillus boronitolerans TaxID=309788 RepID=UPI00289727D1|nr:hypothetical protein [Lysinibacillus boronitolerans]